MKTDPEILRRFVSRLQTLPPHDIELLASITESRKVPKGEIMLGEGQVSRHIILVESGLIRQFYYKNNHDVTEHFSCEGDVVYCIESLFRREPTRLMVEALEEAVVHLIEYDKLEQLFSQSFPLINLYRKFLEADLIISQHKADSLRFENARERYDNFVKQYPEAAKRASCRHIASYLLMTPESLSRVRAGQL